MDSAGPSQSPPSPPPSAQAPPQPGPHLQVVQPPERAASPSSPAHSLAFLYTTQPSPTFSNRTSFSRRRLSAGGLNSLSGHGGGGGDMEPVEEYLPQKRGEIGWRESVHGRPRESAVTLPSVVVGAGPPHSSPEPSTPSSRLSVSSLPSWCQVVFLFSLAFLLFAGTLVAFVRLIPNIMRQAAMMSNTSSSNNSNSTTTDGGDDGNDSNSQANSMSSLGQIGYVLFAFFLIFEIIFLYVQSRNFFIYWRTHYLRRRNLTLDTPQSERPPDIGRTMRILESIFVARRPDMPQRQAPAYTNEDLELSQDDLTVLNSHRTGAAPTYGGQEYRSSTILLRGPKRRGAPASRWSWRRNQPEPEQREGEQETVEVVEVTVEMQEVEGTSITLPPVVATR